MNLYHFDMPTYLFRRGGWENREVCEAYANYAYKAFCEFGKEVRCWFTFNEPIVEPILTMLIVDNMATYASGGAIQSDHYMNMQIINSFALIGGSGCTLCLLLGTFLFSKFKTTKTVSKMSILPGLFNINKPVIYGYPIVFNLPLMIPFVLIPDLFIGITYGLTCAGWISPCIAQAPWTTPPIISALLSTGFDWRAAVWQVLQIVIGMAIYLPFMQISERSAAKQAELAEAQE